MVVWFRLLGDVQAEVTGRLLEVGPARQRCVLVALLVDVNRVVATDELIDRVWGQRVPQRARNSVQAYVSRLRQVLAINGEVRIDRQPGGYRLVVDPLLVDLHRFWHLTRQARSADSSAVALGLLEQALQLWRGAAFANLDTPWLVTVREDLHRQRLAAELDRNDLALGLGRHTELVTELSRAVGAAPLDERLAGQLMLALYRSGRQADALAHYHQVRQRLVEDLGTDPGPALQELHQQILTADSALAIPTIAAARPVTEHVAPRQLPAPLGVFAGRTDELARLDALLTSITDGAQSAAVVISAVSGTAGIGKTALAVYWAHQVCERFPDGQLYVNLRGFDPEGVVLKPAAAIRGFLDALGVPPQRIPADLDAQAALYRSLLAGRRMLVVLDNARDTAQVRPLLPGAPGCLVLVTSRNQLDGLVAADGAHPLSLDLPSIAEAQELLSRRIGADRTAAEPQAVLEIITRCARLPLALAIVAARAATHPQFSLCALATELRDTGDRLDALARDPHSDLRAAFSWSYQALIPEAARLFRLLGLHPGPDVSVPAAASLTGQPLSQVRPLLAELTRASLLVEHTPGRYTFHDLLRAYAAHLAHITDPHQQRQAAIHRVLDHYLHTAHTANLLLNPALGPITLIPLLPGVSPEHPTDHEHALSWFTTEHTVLMTAIDHAATNGLDTYTWQLTWTLRSFLDRRGAWHDQAAAGRAAVAAAQRLADLPAQAHAHRNLAGAYIRLRRFDDAHTHLRHALDLTTRTGDRTEQAHAHNTLAYLWGQRGNNSHALDHARKALHLYETTGHQAGQANALNAVGWFHAMLSEHQQALTSCQQALTLHQNLDNRDGQAHTWDSIGYAYHHLGHHAHALTSYQHALQLFRDLGDRYNEATILTHLGDTYHATGNPQAAHTAWQQALAILEDLDHPDADQLRAKLTTQQ